MLLDVEAEFVVDSEFVEELEFVEDASGLLDGSVVKAELEGAMASLLEETASGEFKPNGSCGAAVSDSPQATNANETAMNDAIAAKAGDLKALRFFSELIKFSFLSNCR